MKTHEKFMEMALEEAGLALEAGEFPVGCVLVHGSNVVARGRRLNSATATVNELDHAEIVALRHLASEQLAIDMSRVVAYSTMEPCLMCYATLLLNGVRTIVYGYEDIMGGGTGLERDALAPLYRQMRVSIIPGVRRDDSLSLFQRFFRDPDNDYWRDSPLAEYTLAQTDTGA